MKSKAVISLTTGLEDPEKVTVAFLVAVAAAEQGRPTLMFCTKEAVRLATNGVAKGVACEGCPSLPDEEARCRGGGPGGDAVRGSRPGRLRVPAAAGGPRPGVVA